MNERERGVWNAAIDAAAEKILNRQNFGYVPDIGCFSCFGHLADAIQSLKLASADEVLG